MPHNSPAMAENASHHEVLDLTDDRPLAVRRKRRISTGFVDPADAQNLREAEADSNTSARPVTTPTTPTKSKKRVRFSDPGPERSTVSSSTGLTPHVNRTSLAANSRASSPSTPRRKLNPRSPSQPIFLSSSLPSPSPPYSPVPFSFSGEVQFAPLCQIVDERTKRRLRRNNLSEELNNINIEQKSRIKMRLEIQILKDELAQAKQLGVDAGASSVERVRELEQELFESREKLSEQPKCSECLVASQPQYNRSTPELDVFVDNTDEDHGIEDFEADGILREIDPTAALGTSNEMATQASLPSPAHVESLRSARLSLEYLFPGEIALGLITEDPKPMLDIMLERLRTLKAQTLVAQDAASTTRTQESNLRTQFNAVLEQLERARRYAEGLSTQHLNEKARADDAQAQMQQQDNNIQTTTERVKELETEVDEKGRSLEKLQDALETYRVEVGKLEILITRQEEEHTGAMTAKQAEMDEAVADLECHVAAETTGRREAEQEVLERDEIIKQLKVQEQELKDAVNEKQRVIRETEECFAAERTGREKEVGGLNVRIGQLTSDLDESKGKVAQMQVTLMTKLQEERDAGQRALDEVQADVARLQTAHFEESQRRGAEVTEHKGLLTPVSACRFKDVDVEGYVDFERGKGKGKGRKRPDSGICVYEHGDEEDEDEDMMTVEDDDMCV